MHSICLSLAAVYTVQEWTASGEHLTFPHKSSYFAYGSISQRQAQRYPSLDCASAPIISDVDERRARPSHAERPSVRIRRKKIRARIRLCGARHLIAASLHIVCTMLLLAANTNSNRRRIGISTDRRSERWIVTSACRWDCPRYYAHQRAILSRAAVTGHHEPACGSRLGRPRRFPARFAPEKVITQPNFTDWRNR